MTAWIEHNRETERFGTGTPELVEKLVAENHEIEVCARDDVAEKRRALVRAIGYDLVDVKFPDTKGGTEIGPRLQRDLCDNLDGVEDPENGPERSRIVGDLTLGSAPGLSADPGGQPNSR